LSKKNLFEVEDFRIVSVSPKKGAPKVILAQVTYGKVGSGSPVNLITERFIYRVRTNDYIGGQVWECEVLEVVTRT
jgi:hypothetical protein